MMPTTDSDEATPKPPCRGHWGLGVLFAMGMLFAPSSAHAYITVPVQSLGALCADSTYVTVVRVDKVSQEKGIVVYAKVADIKGKYPLERVRHAFDLKNTPKHQGSGDVPVRPNEADWKHAMQWAEAGKLAVMFTRKYDPFGDFGHVYIDRCWYAMMCPKRDWDFWYAIYTDTRVLKEWHAGTPEQLRNALEAMYEKREAFLPVWAEGTKEELRAGKAKYRGVRVSLALRDFGPKRDLVTDPFDVTAIPKLAERLKDKNAGVRANAARDLGLLGPSANSTVKALGELVRSDPASDVRLWAAEALASMGPTAQSILPDLEAGLKDPTTEKPPEVRKAIQRAITRLR